MATNFIDYKGKGRWASASISTVWLRLLIQETEPFADAPPWLKKLTEVWELQVKTGSCLNTGFTEIETEEQKEIVIHLMENTLASLEEFGEFISAETLNALDIGGGTYTRDVETEAFKRVGRLFIQLLREEVTTDASYTPLINIVP